eukprot:TRINITY_DN3206_c0_g1_i6.p2 TRINITY_DN3206_c0_g1~~TRINITY_DN3206_c0_g1_i6.p2  ORF type:complete len:140 (-),score=0.28 TRINITY_DN3206_c0_g1_i6:17-436(-)
MSRILWNQSTIQYYSQIQQLDNPQKYVIIQKADNQSQQTFLKARTDHHIIFRNQVYLQIQKRQQIHFQLIDYTFTLYFFISLQNLHPWGDFSRGRCNDTLHVTSATGLSCTIQETGRGRSGASSSSSGGVCKCTGDGAD